MKADCYKIGSLALYKIRDVYTYLRHPRCLGKVCCAACPTRLLASGIGRSDGCKAGLTLKDQDLLAAGCGRQA